MTKITDIQLSELNFAAKVMLDRELLKNGIHGGMHALDVYRDLLENRYVIQIRSKFWAQSRDFNLPPTPLTWWDHFKRDAIPTFTRLLGLKVEQKWEVLKAATIFPDVPQIPGGRYYYAEVCPAVSNYRTGDVEVEV